MSAPPHAVPIAFRLGQLDALAQLLLGAGSLYPTDIQHCFALMALTRAWAQYREDRAITLGARLIGAECTAQRNAFLALLERALPPGEQPLSQAIRRVRKIAIRPMREEAEQTAALLANSTPDLDTVLSLLACAPLPLDPLERLLTLVERLRYSSGDAAATSDPLAATALTPCWALNLAATARSPAFHLGQSPLPCPGIATRALFRADRSAEQHRQAAFENLLNALHQTAGDIARLPRVAALFARTFPQQRSTSRLLPAWLLLFGLGGLTPAQLARALPATKAGAGKLLRQLEAGRLCTNSGPFEPFLPAITVPVSLPDGPYALTESTEPFVG